MPAFEPFYGLRYSPSHVRSLDDVVCPPYDVISEAERVALSGRSPVNAVRLELPAPLPGDRSTQDRYTRARELLDAWRDGGFLHRDDRSCFYGYRMSYKTPDGRPAATLGVIGALGLEDPGVGILPHEETLPKAKTDRLDLLRATRTNLSPIWCLSPVPGLTDLLEPPAHAAERVSAADGVTHELWPIDDVDRIAGISAAVGSRPVLIADGHHRFETALNYRAEVQEGIDSGSGAAAVMSLVVELSEEQLTVQAIHRLLTGVPAGFDLPQALSLWFDLSPAGPLDRSITSQMVEAGGLAVLTSSGTWIARPRVEVAAAAAHDLDSSRLDVAVASLTAGPAPRLRLSYQHGWDNCAAAVAAGAADAAVLLRPASVSQIAAIASGGVRMPPKTTFFWPKPLTGLVMRELLG